MNSSQRKIRTKIIHNNLFLKKKNKGETGRELIEKNLKSNWGFFFPVNLYGMSTLKYELCTIQKISERPRSQI